MRSGVHRVRRAGAPQRLGVVRYDSDRPRSKASSRSFAGRTRTSCSRCACRASRVRRSGKSRRCRSAASAAGASRAISSTSAIACASPAIPARRSANNIFVRNILLPSGREIVLGGAARWSTTRCAAASSCKPAKATARGRSSALFRTWSTGAVNGVLFPEAVQANFDFSRYPLTPSARAALDAFDFATDDPTVELHAEGHADDHGAAVSDGDRRSWRHHRAPDRGIRHAARRARARRRRRARGRDRARRVRSVTPSDASKARRSSSRRRSRAGGISTASAFRSRPTPCSRSVLRRPSMAHGSTTC